MQAIAIEIEDLEELLMNFADRIIKTIDPTIDKFQNMTIGVMSSLESHIAAATFKTLYGLETNLFLLLFGIIIFFIFVLILLNLLDNLLAKYKFLLESRRSIGLAVITIVFIWLFIAMVFSAGLSSSTRLNLRTLQYVSVGLLSLILLCLAFVWIGYLYNHRTRIYNTITSGCDHHKHSKTSTKERSIHEHEDIALTHS